MKVLHLGKFYPPYHGGMERVLENLCNGLQQLGVDVTALVANTTSSSVSEIREGVRIFRSGRWGEFSSVSICPRFPLDIRRFPADIIHIHHPHPWADLSYLLARPKAKLVIWHHSDILRQKYLLQLYKPFLKTMLRKADGITAASPRHFEFSDYLGPYHEKCRVIHFGIDFDKYQPQNLAEIAQIRARYPFRPMILFVGRLVYYKGMEFLIRAMPYVAANLIIVGRGPLLNPLKALAADLALDDRVFLAESVTENQLTTYFQACDLFVLPSIAKTEAFGMVQLEAMACGKPVISTDLPTGVPYVNQHQKTGIIVPPGNSQALAAAINDLLSAPDQMQAMGEAGRQRVKNEFTIESMARSTLNLYQEILTPFSVPAGPG